VRTNDPRTEGHIKRIGIIQMKSKVVISIAVSALSIISPGSAEDARPGVNEPRTNSRTHATDRAGHSNLYGQLNRVEKASDLIGTEVRNLRDEKLGKVDDLGVSLESGRVAIVVVSVGGLLGVGDSLVAVPPSALHLDTAKKVAHLDAEKEKLKSAPQIELSKWDACCDPNRVSEVYRYYGQEPYFSTADAPGARRAEAAPGLTKPTQRADTTRYVLGSVSKASKIIGMSVRNKQEEKLGKVENLMVDLPANRIVAVVVSSGGFLGLGDELSAVPPAAFQYNADKDALVLDATKDSLGNAPHFKANEWPAFNQPAYTESVYRAYQIDPYFTGRPKDADNTARNVRDRDDRTVTPLDQGNNAADLDTTARIRKEVLADKALSINGHNVKIITSNGRVTLRGVVNSEEERKRIAEIARTLSSSERVDDQIEVKINK
jgi:hyperosmotically inducible protein